MLKNEKYTGERKEGNKEHKEGREGRFERIIDTRWKVKSCVKQRKKK